MEIVGIGNALMDVIAFVDEAYAPKLGFHNNAVMHFERSKLDPVLAELGDASVSAGGGVANAMRAAAYLGARHVRRHGGRRRVRSSATRRKSSLRAWRLSLSIRATGPEYIAPSSGPTGAGPSSYRPAPPSTSASSPPRRDYLSRGLCSTSSASCSPIGPSSWIASGERARPEWRSAMDLASRALAAANREFILALLPDYCDVLFANEDEFVALAGLPLREGIELFARTGHRGRRQAGRDGGSLG